MKKLTLSMVTFLIPTLVSAQELTINVIEPTDPGGCGFFMWDDRGYVFEWLYINNGATMVINSKNEFINYNGRAEKATDKLDILELSNKKYNVKLVLNLTYQCTKEEMCMESKYNGNISIKTLDSISVFSINGESRC